ncbi:MAG: hypothetical protein ABH873_08725 [Candidatus Firestonebacteria bacterium]
MTEKDVEVVKADPAKKASFGGKIIKWSKVKDVRIGEIFGDKDCGMGEQIKLIWAFIKKNKINE